MSKFFPFSFKEPENKSPPINIIYPKKEERNFYIPPSNHIEKQSDMKKISDLNKITVFRRASKKKPV